MLTNWFVITVNPKSSDCNRDTETGVHSQTHTHTNIYANVFSYMLLQFQYTLYLLFT